MKEFLLEIGMEEVPHNSVDKLRDTIGDLLEGAFKKDGVRYEGFQRYSTPRRFIYHIRSLEAVKSGKVVSRKGMPLNKAYENGWTPMGLGFLKNLNLSSDLKLESIELFGSHKENRHRGLYLFEEAGQSFLYLHQEEASEDIKTYVSNCLIDILKNTQWDTAMRWGSSALSFIRPISYICSFYGDEELSINVDGIRTGAKTRAHRQLHSDKWLDVKLNNYFDTLLKHDVVYDPEKRKESILEQMKSLEKKENFKVHMAGGLLGHVVNLVESPHVMVCDFEKEFLTLPKELLISQMVGNQFYFPCLDGSENLINRFVVVANVSDEKYVKRGYEKVLRARLSDALFLYGEDKKTPMEVLKTRQNGVQFVGSTNYGDRTAVVKKMLQSVVSLGGKAWESAMTNLMEAQLVDIYKADLSSKVVYEFPELQGIMGTYYMKGISLDRWAPLIQESYLVFKAGDKVNLCEESVLLNLCDKLSNIYICFKEGLQPTGSSDPYGLRRDAISVIVTLIEKNISINLFTLFEKMGASKELSGEVWEFIKARLKKVLTEYGFGEVETTTVLNLNSSNVLSMHEGATLISKIRQDKDFEAFQNSFKRIKNILQSEKVKYDKLSPNELKDESERRVYDFYSKHKDEVLSLSGRGAYEEAYRRLTGISPLLVVMFEKVMIKDSDDVVKNNRLALLSVLLEWLGEAGFKDLL